MKIKKMTATFGGLEQAVLEPSQGLTVITAPNEAGKSTWAGFLKAMLYGIDTKERDKAGFLADKNRYQPWSGAPMAGELQVEWQGSDITIRRFAAKSNSFGGFEAVYTASGDPVPGLTAANVGEQLTGGGKEVFLRSAFIGEHNLAVSHSGELEARIAALATSGQEDVSYSATERILKDWRNRRRANRSNGLIPELEAELGAIEQSLQTMANARRREAEVSAEIARLQEEKRQIQMELELWRRIEAHDLNRRYGQVLEQLEQAKGEYHALTPPIPEMSDWTVQDAREWAADREEQYQAALEERSRILKERADVEQKGTLPARLAVAGTVVLTLAAIVLAVLGWREILTFNPSICLYLLVAACACLLCRNKLVTSIFRKLEELEVPELPEKFDWYGEAQQHTDFLARKEQLRQNLIHLQQRADDLAAQGATPYDTLELIHPPAQSRSVLEARLRSVEGELARRQGELSRTEGALQQMGDPAQLEAQHSQLEEQLAQRTGEFDALTIAMEALSEANTTLRARFSPALNQTAGEIFSALTGGRWPNLSLARDFTAQATGQGDVLPRSALALSAGTTDQLYLAVRLAVCRMTLPDCPILLDDALTAFDDARMELALDHLSKLGEERQILLFSCHSREARWAGEHQIPTISLT